MKTITVITPTTGKVSLDYLISSIQAQEYFDDPIEINHILLFDALRQRELNLQDYVYYSVIKSNYKIQLIEINGNFVQGKAAGSSLRAIGLMAASSDYVTFADDDVTWNKNHVQTMLDAIGDKNWCITKRNIWKKLKDSDGFEYIGVDDFESVGEEAKTPYKMVDNNCMLFSRKFGSIAAPLYRETTEYNDDRLMYNFLIKFAGPYAKTDKATINQVCPERLEKFFENFCTKENNTKNDR